MKKLSLTVWEQLGLWAVGVVCLLPLVPYALHGLNA